MLSSQRNRTRTSYIERSGDGSFEWITFEFSRANQEVQEVPGLPESRGIKGARGLDDSLVQKRGRRARGLEGERAAAQEKKEERER